MLPTLGRFLKFWKRARLVVYLQDIYPDVAIALNKISPGFITKAVRLLLFGAYKRADRIIVLSHDMKQRLVEQGVDGNKIVIIPNWVDTQVVFPVKGGTNKFRLEQELNGKFVVMHSGNMGLTQQLDQLVEVAEHPQLQERHLFPSGGRRCCQGGKSKK